MSKITITRATANVELVTNLDLLADHEAATNELERAQKTESPDRLNSSASVRAAAKRVEHIENEMESSIIVFKLRALARKRWVELVDAHPAREDDDMDQRFGFNADELFNEALPESIVAVTTKSGDTVDWSPEDWEEISEEISDAQYAEFVGAVFRLNQRESEIPFSRTASILNRTSDKTSK